MNGSQWEKLFQSFARRRAAKRQHDEHMRELVTWYDEQTELVMTLVRQVASERAASFAQGSGVEIEVKSPSHPPINIDPDGPFMSFMCLRVGDREVHLYSHRVGTGAPVIHFVVAADRSAGPERKGLLGHPGCRIERRDGGGFLLRRVGTAQDVLSVDDLVYRAFELLLAPV